MKSIERYHSLDCLKFICAVGVVFIHFGYYFQQFYNAFDRCAVPIFYMISGFFIFGENGIGVKRLYKVIKKVTIILVIGSLLYVIQLLLSNSDIFYYLNRKAIFDCVLWGCNPFVGHLWYLQCYIYSLVILLLFKKLGIINSVLPFLPFLLVVNLLLGNYCIFFEPTNGAQCIYSRNHIFCALPFVAIGSLVKKRNHEIKIFVKNHDVLFKWLIPLSFLFSIVESYCCGNGVIVDLSIFNIISSVIIFLYFVTKHINSNLISYLGCHYSLPIYIIHPFVGYVLDCITRESLNISLFNMPQPVLCFLPLIVVISSIMIIYVYRFLKKQVIRCFDNILSFNNCS